MTTLLRQYGLYAFFFALAVGTVGCDSDNPVDPPVDTTEYCDDNPANFGCLDSGVVYDTTGTDVDDRPIINVRDVQGGIGGELGDDPQTTVTWSNQYTYVLDGLVFVNAGQTLEIEAGTIIRGRSGQGRNASALIVARGGRIEARGEADAPIILTALNDDVDDPADLVENGAPRSGLWGGLIVLGDAPTNIAAGETNIEGIDVSEPRGLYGGDDEDDNSGTIRYVSIRHGGTLIGEGNEINGFTLGAVGSGTTIEYVEVFANQDDGVEWFGGTAEAKYLAVAYSGDDMYDYDQGYNGVNQYVFGLMDSEFGDNAGEHDGGDSDLGGDLGEAALPYAVPVFANVTYVGSGLTAPNSSRVLTIRDNAGGQYWRAIFYGFQNGVRIEDRDDEDTTENDGGDSRERAEAGDISFVDVVISNVVAATPTFDEVFGFYEEAPDDDTAVDPDDLVGPITYADPGFTINRGQGGALDLSSSLGAGSLTPFPGGLGLEETDFIGAFGEENWLEGWTALSQFNSF
ncbi:MAG: T9SS C-terminal target domain-containing protein [Rhodothermales bacterium]|nr:T9SS C-terminal target domain-containing protein [Rhodothermales bacterium]